MGAAEPPSFVRSFPALHFDVTKRLMFGVTNKNTGKPQFSVQVMEEMHMWIAIIFVTDCCYLCGVNFW